MSDGWFFTVKRPSDGKYVMIKITEEELARFVLGSEEVERRAEEQK
jgi:hypothetical protein